MRYEKRFDRRQMASWMGLSDSAYYKNETAQSFPQIPTLHRLVHERGISLDWLFFGKGPMYLKDKVNAEELAAELEKTKQQLDMLTKEKENAAAGFRESLKPGVNDLLNDFDQDPKLYYATMMFYQEYKEKQEKKEK